MADIDFSKIESKWQKKWEKEKLFEVNDTSKSKNGNFYVLEMFPYPSGDGLHMGHALNYVIGDVLARFKMMNGFTVLHPMGYDALGLPAENAAIKVGTHPGDYTNKAIKNYISQQKSLGITYDWSRVINTADPKYYKWDQWIFLKMLEKGLAYQKESAVNFCSLCDTVLANEQVVDGKCWRHEDTEVETRKLRQWFLKITDYANELYESIDALDGWPEKTKAMQKNWIGKSKGLEIDFEIDGSVGNVVLVHGSPGRDKTKDKDYIPQNDEHWMPWLKKELSDKGINVEAPLMPSPWKPDYSKWKKQFEKVSINKNSILIGHSAGGAFLVRWLGETKKKIKKLILISAGKIKVPDSKRLDKFYEFNIDNSIKNNIGEIIIFISDNELDYRKKNARVYEQSLNGNLIELKGTGHFCKSDGVTEFPELLNQIVSNEKWPVFTTRADTIFGVTFMVISARHEKLMDIVADSERKKVEAFLGKLHSVSEKDLFTMEKEGVFTGAYAVNPANDERIPVYAGNFVVADYGSGMVMAVPAHDKRDFEFAKKYKIDIRHVVDGGSVKNGAYTGDGDLINSGKFNGMNNRDAIKKISEWLIKKKFAKKIVNFRLRDWGISRQRYWGTPIPIVHCDKCGAVPVLEKNLPVVLPKDVTFGEGNPLETNHKWVNVKCPQCFGKAKRETDTMDTFVNSSWYFLRFCDPHNDKNIFDPRRVNDWCPIDQYIGGAEHACMHLIYFRFYTKFLRDLGLITFDEPAKKMFHQGMLHGEGGIKMSKSKGKGNVINPEDVSAEYGIDTARYFLLSLAEPDKRRDWSEKGIIGSLRFINKIFDVFDKVIIGKSTDPVEVLLNKTILGITQDIETFRYRMATIKLKQLFDALGKEMEVSRDVLEKSLKLLSPICPHVAEELWAKLGNKDFISVAEWPTVDKKKLNSGSEGQVDLNDAIVRTVKRIIDKVGKKDKIMVYVMPFELSKVNSGKIGKAVGQKVKVYSVGDKNKYDPDNKARNAKPGMPSVFVE